MCTFCQWVGWINERQIFTSIQLEHIYGSSPVHPAQLALPGIPCFPVSTKLKAISNEMHKFSKDLMDPSVPKVDVPLAILSS